MSKHNAGLYFERSGIAGPEHPAVRRDDAECLKEIERHDVQKRQLLAA